MFLFALTALVASSLAAPRGSASARDEVPVVPVEACFPGGARPCLESVTRNGGPPPAEYLVFASTFKLEMLYVQLYVEKVDGRLGLDELGAEWSFTIDLGRLVPRVVGGAGRDTTVTRTRSDRTYKVTVTAKPVLGSGDCDQAKIPWTCPEYAADPSSGGDRVGLFVQVTDYGVWEDVKSRNAMYGLDYFSNISGRATPPDVRRDPDTGEQLLHLDLANRHYLQDGTTVFQGEAELRIPNAFLRYAYGVPNPELMTGASLDVNGAGGAAVVITQDPVADAMLVDISGMTFSHRKVKVKRGTITPSRPSDVRAKRLSPTRARVSYDRATPRGARIRGYQVKCRTPFARVVLATGTGRKVVVNGLRPGTAYRCQVRALSKAGPGRYSKTVKLSARR